MRVRTAVIPCAGKGTRFQPITRTVPKELLPMVAKPALQLVVEECAGAGIEHVVLVSSRAKPAIAGFAADVVDHVPGLRITVTYQDEPLGLGHAVGCARRAVAGEPFAVLLPDELMGDSSLLAQMIAVCERTGGSVVGLKRVPRTRSGPTASSTPPASWTPTGWWPCARWWRSRRWRRPPAT